MAHLIDKDALVAEIERLKNTSLEYGYNTMQKVLADSGKDLSLGQLQYFLDTLEVKEVNLEKELDSMITPELKLHKALPSLYDVAKHFFELGICVNSIEVKEVDLEKEISFQWSKFCLNGKDKDSFVEVAKHFFERGLKAQKGE